MPYENTVEVPKRVFENVSEFIIGKKPQDQVSLHVLNVLFLGAHSLLCARALSPNSCLIV